MKILHIIPNLKKGGAERLVIDIIAELKKREKLSVKLILFSNEIEYDVNQIMDAIQVIPSSISLSLWRKNKYHVSDLQNFLNDFQPDVIHTHLLETEIVSRTCFYPKAKWFSHIHSNMKVLKNLSLQTILNKAKLTQFFEKKYLLKQYRKNNGNHFIAISNNTLEFANQVLPISFAKYKLANAIDYNKFANKNNSFLNKKLSLVNVGKISKNKNQTFLIDVVKILKDKNVSFELNFLGDGPEKGVLEEKVKQLNLEDQVFFKGAVLKVENYLKEANIYVHAALSEAFGLVLIEAMAASLPIISLDGKGNRDIIEEGKNGYMLFDQNAAEFAEKIIELWKDKMKMEEISVYAQSYAEQYDIKAYIDKLLKHYLL